MLKYLALAGLAATLAAVSAPAGAQYTDYEQCLIDHCFGNFEGDPVGYEKCRRACASKYPPQIMAVSIDPVAKLD